MKNEEKINQKIREASHKTSETSFPGMNKVWSRVEEKLDTKIIKKKSEVWKKIAIAASFLLFFTVGIQLYNTQKKLTDPIVPNVNTKVISSEKVQDSVTNEFTIPNTENTESSTPEVETFVNSNKVQSDKGRSPEIILDTKGELIQEDVLVEKDENHIEPNKSSLFEEEISNKDKLLKQKETIVKRNQNTANSYSNSFLNNRNTYAARSSNLSYEVIEEQKKEQSHQAKSDDLVIIDGYLSEKKSKDIDEDEFETYVELKNPIYIINSEEFSEESLFGENPTSKYAPLNLQKIDSIKVYLPEEAIPIYGEKGKNGIVIISIKK